MNCREFVGSLGDFVTVEAAEERLADLDAHLSECLSCAVYTTTYLDASRLGRTTLLAVENEAALPEELVRAVMMRCLLGGERHGRG